MNEYVVLDDLKAYRGIGADEKADDTLLKGFCSSASRVFERLARGRLFYPRIATRYYDHPGDPRVLKLDDDLLEIDTFTTQNGAETVAASDYFLLCGDTYNMTPYNRIVMKPDGDYPLLLYSGRLQQANAISGAWGYHEDWANAWRDSNDTVQDTGGINAAVSALTVANAAGSDAYGQNPRFKAQQLLRIEAEYLYVLARSSPTATLTVKRGVNGSTAAAHDKDTPIYIYEPMEAVFHAVRRLAAWLYQQKDSSEDIDRPVVTDAGVTLMPSAVPKDVRDVAMGLRR